MNEPADAGRVIWITGLSGAGKTTLARAVTDRLRARGRSVVLLDGDELRHVFGAAVPGAQTHGRDGRLALALQYAHLCRLIAAQGVTVVIATISLFREVHTWNRAHLPDYFEVYLKVPLEELRRRDPKGLYARFDAGDLANVAGLDVAVDAPDAADCVLEFDPALPATAAADALIRQLESAEPL